MSPQEISPVLTQKSTARRYWLNFILFHPNNRQRVNNGLNALRIGQMSTDPTEVHSRATAAFHGVTMRRSDQALDGLRKYLLQQGFSEQQQLPPERDLAEIL